MADYEGDVVRLALLAGDDGVIRDMSFERCDVKGPAVVVPTGKTVLEHNRILGNADALFWVIPPERPTVIGAIGLENCRFTGCEFTNVGFAGPPELIDRLRNP
jgi:hypothetical protein